ncbi:hypothetical protein FPS10_02855 [Pseudoruegeria sp. M32A2M]|nr:hypothetical protein [Pseudoruegeria sp. M32A2M]
MEETDLRDTPSHLWVSATPLIGPNHAWAKPGRLKPGQDLLSQAAREIADLRSLPRVLELTVTRPGEGAPWLWTQTPVRRKLPHYAVWGWLAVLLAQPSSTPFAAGALSHWGLGAFRPATGIFHDLR